MSPVEKLSIFMSASFPTLLLNAMNPPEWNLDDRVVQKINQPTNYDLVESEHVHIYSSSSLYYLLS